MSDAIQEASGKCKPRICLQCLQSNPVVPRLMEIGHVAVDQIYPDLAKPFSFALQRCLLLVTTVRLEALEALVASDQSQESCAANNVSWQGHRVCSGQDKEVVPSVPRSGWSG